jgi:dipeptidyl aminopeptidase/acylaminoacyl peptidase
MTRFSVPPLSAARLMTVPRRAARFLAPPPLPTAPVPTAPVLSPPRRAARFLALLLLTARLLAASLLALPVLAASVALAAPAVVRGNLVLDGIPEQPDESADVLDAYLSARRAVPLGFTPKGQLLIATRFGDVPQLHLLDHPLAERFQITFSHDPITQAAFSPDPGHSAYFYLTDAAGDGHTQIFYRRSDDTAARRLTDGRSINGSPVWSSAGRELAFFTNARDGASFDIDIVEPESGALPHLVVAGDGALWYPLDWSPDDRKLLVEKHVSAAEDHLFVVDLGTGQKREVEPGASRIAITDAKFSRDGTGVYFIADLDGEYAKLRFVNLFTAEKLDISGRMPWDVERFSLSRDGHYLAYVSNEEGADKLHLLDLRNRQDLIPPRLPAAGTIDSLSFDRDGKLLVFGFSAATQPEDAYVLDIAGNRLEPWTLSEAGPLDRSKLAVPRVAQFPTFDRSDGKSRQIPLYVYEPSGPGPHPVLILLHDGPLALHDGPLAQARPAFDPWVQYVVNELGFVVLAPNVRGSTGYGRSFGALARGTLREDAVKDVGALLVWLSLDARFDAKRVVVAGAGYGGYLALAALANYGERLRGAVDLGGITDFIGFVSGTPADRRSQAREEFGDERDTDARAFLRRISPLTGAERITRPVLLVHGRNDPLVPASQSDEMVNRLRSRGAVVWYLSASNEGHEFARWADREALYRTFAQFLSFAR